jgi:serpin B
VDEIIGRLENRRVTLTMPKFEFESDFSLKETLAALGMMVNHDLFIADVLNKAFVSVDEAGTEAFTR